MRPKIKIKDLKKSFDSHEVLSNINLEIATKSSAVILGSSGTGKSVLIKSIVGLIKPDSGEIWIDDIETTRINRKRRFELMAKCGFLFQSGALFDSLTVMDNITFFMSRMRNLSYSEKCGIAEEKLRIVGLKPEVMHLFPSELSGGMQKRVSLARVICSNPEIIFFDEPTTGLDPIMSNVINDLIIKAKTELGATTITITHDLESARKIADTVYLMHKGNIVWSGIKGDMSISDNPYLLQFLNGINVGPMSAD